MVETDEPGGGSAFVLVGDGTRRDGGVEASFFPCVFCTRPLRSLTYQIETRLNASSSLTLIRSRISEEGHDDAQSLSGFLAFRVSGVR